MATNSQSLFYSRAGKLTVELAGEIHGSRAAEVCYRIEMLGLHECTLNFSRVEAIDVFGARVLARGLKGLKHRGVRLDVEGLREPVTQALCLGGVLEALV